MDKANERKREREAVMIRKLQREKEQDGAIYGQTETFVTTAYKEKLLEMEKQKSKEVEGMACLHHLWLRLTKAPRR